MDAPTPSISPPTPALATDRDAAARTASGVAAAFRHVQAEDVLLVGLLLATPVVGDSATAISDAILHGGTDPAPGLLSLLAALGALAGLATRPPGESPLDMPPS